MVSHAVQLAMAGGTIHLGQLLAAQGVQYIVVVDGLSPSATGLAESVEAPPPSGLQQALMNQNDLQIVPGEFGVQVFKNADVIPLTAQRSRPVASKTLLSWPTSLDVTGWRPVLSTPESSGAATGVLSAGPVYAGYAPAGSFALTERGRSLERQPVFGWAGQYLGASVGKATLALRQVPYVPLAVTIEVLVWLALAVALLGWPRRLWPRRRDRVKP
jgi:hypothetical protein